MLITQLKAKEAITSLTAGKKVFIINCHGCKEVRFPEKEAAQLQKELAAEGKRWYDLVRFGKAKNYKYKTSFIDLIVANNPSIGSKWLRSVLKDNNAWFLPIHQDEIDRNPVLTQNPYYDVTAN